MFISGIYSDFGRFQNRCNRGRQQWFIRNFYRFLSSRRCLLFFCCFRRSFGNPNGWLCRGRSRFRRVFWNVIAFEGSRIGQVRFHRTIVNGIIVRKDVQFSVNLATASEVESIYASSQMCSIGFDARERKHANSRFSSPPRNTWQMSDISPRTYNNENYIIIYHLDALPRSANIHVFIHTG